MAGEIGDRHGESPPQIKEGSDAEMPALRDHGCAYAQGFSGTAHVARRPAMQLRPQRAPHRDAGGSTKVHLMGVRIFSLTDATDRLRSPNEREVEFVDIFYTDDQGRLRYSPSVMIVAFKGDNGVGWRAGFVTREQATGNIIVTNGEVKTTILASQNPSFRNVGDLLVDDASGTIGRGGAPVELKGRETFNLSEARGGQ